MMSITSKFAPTLAMVYDDVKGMNAAYEQALKSYNEGGVPIGGCLMDSDNKILGCSHNQRMQKGSPTLHGETAALEAAGRLPGKVYKQTTMYTTLSPCDMCTGAILLYGIPRVVIGENETFMGAEEYLKQRGVEVIVVKDSRCKELMDKFIQEKPEEWNEDIGV